jgi:hypothetical protein
MVAASDILSTSFKWAFTDNTDYDYFEAVKISLSPNNLYLIVAYDRGFLLFLNSTNGNILS